MDARPLNKELSVSTQITTDDIISLKEAGYKSVVINRPDNEVVPELAHEHISHACEQHGLAVRFIPITPGQISPQDVGQFNSALNKLPSPTLAYCKTGTRSAYLWAFSQAGTLPVDEILNACAQAGYDLSALKHQLQTLAGD